MRCMACCAEMILTSVARHDTLPVAGFEYHTFMCSECRDIERRFVFTKGGRESDAALAPVQTAPPIVPASAVHDEPLAVPGLFRRMLAKLRSR